MRAETSITKPSVPEFTVKLVNHSSDTPTTYSIDPYTGKNVTHPGSPSEWKTLEVTIKNHPFVPYNDSSVTPSFYYNIRVKGHFGEDWTELYRPSDGYPTQSDSENTVIPLGNGYSLDSGTIAIDFPPGAQVDFQVEALIGYSIGSFKAMWIHGFYW